MACTDFRMGQPPPPMNFVFCLQKRGLAVLLIDAFLNSVLVV